MNAWFTAGYWLTRYANLVEPAEAPSMPDLPGAATIELPFSSATSGIVLEIVSVPHPCGIAPARDVALQNPFGAESRMKPARTVGL